jgi:hypothetical protein
MAWSGKILPHSPNGWLAVIKHGPPLVARGDQLEQDAGFGLILGDVGDVVEDQQIVAVELGDAALQTLPEHHFDAVLKLERRVSHDGFVAIGGNYYSVPDRTRRVVEVQQLPDLIRILDLGIVVAAHPVAEGRKQYRIDRSHRTGGTARRKPSTTNGITLGRIGDLYGSASSNFDAARCPSGGSGGAMPNPAAPGDRLATRSMPLHACPPGAYSHGPHAQKRVTIRGSDTKNRDFPFPNAAAR